MPQESLHLLNNPALIFLGQAFPSYLQYKPRGYLVCAPANLEQSKVSIELLRHLNAFVLQSVEVQTL
jgi:hypothetical protein